MPKKNVRYDPKNPRISVYRSHPVLSKSDISHYAQRLSVYAHMLSVCPGGLSEAPPTAGILSHRQTTPILPPLGRQWLRSGAVKNFTSNLIPF
jgi:hypothetical protein